MSAAKKKAAPKARKAAKARPAKGTSSSKKAAAKKAPRKKATAKKAPAKKAAAKKTAPVKTAAKKKTAPAQPAAKKKVVQKKAARSSTRARVAPAPLPVPVKKAKPLSAHVLEHFKKKLLAEKQRVLEEMGELTSSTFMKSISEEAGENSRYSYHLGDVASLSYGREFSMGLAERQQNYLEQIDDALQRIEDGTYGICKVTGEQIPAERLEEVPVAKYSVRGKEILSHRQRFGADERRAAAAEERSRRVEVDDSQSDGDNN